MWRMIVKDLAIEQNAESEMICLYKLLKLALGLGCRRRQTVGHGDLEAKTVEAICRGSLRCCKTH